MPDVLKTPDRHKDMFVNRIGVVVVPSRQGLNGTELREVPAEVFEVFHESQGLEETVGIFQDRKECAGSICRVPGLIAEAAGADQVLQTIGEYRMAALVHLKGLHQQLRSGSDDVLSARRQGLSGKREGTDGQRAIEP